MVTAQELHKNPEWALNYPVKRIQSTYVNKLIESVRIGTIPYTRAYDPTHAT